LACLRDFRRWLVCDAFQIRTRRQQKRRSMAALL